MSANSNNAAEQVAQFRSACAAAQIDARIVPTLEHRVLWLRIERSDKHNALALDMLAAIAQVLRLAAAQLNAQTDPDWLRLVVITGSGVHSFAAGGDLKELDAVRSAEQTRAMTERGMQALNAIRDFPQPVVAALNGAARGGGAELAMACDLRVAHSGAAIGFIQGRLNLSPAWGGGSDLMQLLGPARALQVLAEAEVLPASQALELGLINRLIADDAAGFTSALEDYIALLAQRPTQILRAHKALVLALRTGANRDALQAVESEQLVVTWTHEDHWRAAAGALKK